MSGIDWNALEATAQNALTNAYAPYSRFHVGAAVLTGDGHIYSGCNVENASYGGAVCAERVAVWKAVSEGHRRIAAVLVTTRQGALVPPCGICRQVINEFAASDCPVVMSSAAGESKETTLGALLPESFGPQHLKLDPR